MVSRHQSVLTLHLHLDVFERRGMRSENGALASKGSGGNKLGDMAEAWLSRCNGPQEGIDGSDVGWGRTQTLGWRRTNAPPKQK